MSTAEPVGRPSAWFRSSYSNGAGGECVECAISRDRAHVRDSKDTDALVVTVTHRTWASFLQALKDDRLAR
ncbi:DUF397 domain-containing protein [Streptomyces griseomycini]|uniref:DUF397 domain-containing protein n=1 Tax=Streptomyces griseomycini TaxID=66895 RepID=UPI00341DE05C